jgi:predicted nuclease of predicted toxin-antitoxin system
VKVRADEHVAPKIVRALKEVSLSPGWELSHVRDSHGARTADETWVPKFASEGGRAIITADANMLKRPHQILAIQQSGVIGLILPSVWAQSKRHVQASSLIYFWPEIEACFTAGAPGEFWRIPTHLHRGPLEKLNINYAQATQAAQPPPSIP